MPPTSTDSPDLRLLLESWLVHLRAERKSRETVKSYGDGVRRFLAWCDANDTEPVLVRSKLTAFIADLLDGGAEGATASARHLAVRQFSAWAFTEGEIDKDDLAGLKRPKVDVKVIKPLSLEEVQAMISVCESKDFFGRRDEALIRFMTEVGSRASETLDLALPGDVDMRHQTATIRRGKGGKGRVVSFGPHTARALDRYMRLRRSHRLADTPPLWLGDRGKTLGYFGLYATLTMRAEQAGVVDFNPHRLRNTAACRWLSAGGSEGGAMTHFGWVRRETLHRYTQATASERAIEEARKLNLGDF